LFSQPKHAYKISFADTIPGFTSIKASGNVVVSIRQDQFFGITFKGDRIVIKDVFSSIKVNNHCLIIDAGKLFENEFIYVDVVMPVIDTVKLYENASIITPTNLWLKRLYVENYSQKKSTVYINGNECNIILKGEGEIELSGIVDILRLYSFQSIHVSAEFLTKLMYCESQKDSKISLKGKSFAGEFHSYNSSVIDALDLSCGRAKAFASDNSLINVKSEEKPLILSLKKGKIQYLSPDPIVIDSIGIKNIKEK